MSLKFAKTIRLLLTFYKSFFLLNSLITLACLGLFLEYGWSIFTVLFWFKLATLALVFYYIRSYKRKEFYYYRNLGLSGTFLWTPTLLFDFALYLFVLIQVHKLTILMKHTLEADSIQLDFGLRQILADIHIRCGTGKITGLLGRNGQGKTCLLRIIYGDLAAGNRSVRFDNRTIARPFERPDLIRYLPQFDFIPGSLTLQRVCRDFELDFRELEQRFPEFRSSHNSQVRQLSGGQRRMVHIYLIVRSKSLFALLDEPYSHLMPLQVEKVKEMLLEEKDNKGLLITDHLYRHVLDISDSLYVLVNGKTHLANDHSDIGTLGYILPERLP